jgi:hypothetical protein
MSKPRLREASMKGKASYQWKERSHTGSTLDDSSSVVIGLITFRDFIEVCKMYHKHRFRESSTIPISLMLGFLVINMREECIGIVF